MDESFIHPHDREFVKEKLLLLPNVFKQKVMRSYEYIVTKKSRKEANLYLLEIEETISSSIVHRLNTYSLNLDESDLKTLSSLKEKKCTELWLLAKSKDPKNLAMPYKRILAYIRKHGIEPSFLKENPTDNDHKSLIRRSRDSLWWLRNLRKVQNRDIETVARAINLISKTKEIYASNLNVFRRKKQKKQQQEYLEKMVATNELDEQFNLNELKETSVSNPYIRKSELMVRCRGFEDYAKQSNHISLFLTMTCPSKYHRAYSQSGDPSPNWNGARPIEGQQYLSRTWSRTRAAFKRENILPYGFRISEPHHDGTPHWHLLLFVEPENKAKLLSIMTHYCFEEDGDEKGAAEHRFEIVEIDPNKGSATGYIAKYISKNIDGKDLDEGVYGENPIIAAERVETWASIWAIRQFQQIGGAQVSIWRELRRLGALAETKTVIEKARQAADTSDWSGYQEVMGGVICLRKDRPIKLVYKEDVDTTTGELKPNQYEELCTPRILGLQHESTRVITRPHSWKISRSL
ncbi:MAG: replication protein [Piscirickettsiaceae bacterium]|nr:MAG: replication protein [Piscirickettsiaceae bacterium]